MDFFYSIAGFFSSGGLFMFPILLVFAVGLGIAIERYVTLSMVTNKNQQVWERRYSRCSRTVSSTRHAS
jgi:biopolymer transport protein ExbB